MINTPSIFINRSLKRVRAKLRKTATRSWLKTLTREQLVNLSINLENYKEETKRFTLGQEVRFFVDGDFVVFFYQHKPGNKNMAYVWRDRITTMTGRNVFK